MADDVRLTDLQVIQRYSIAVRGETADRDELIRALRADLEWLQGSGGRRSTGESADRASSRSAPAPAPRRSAPASRPVAKKQATTATTTAKKTAARKPAKPARRSR